MSSVETTDRSAGASRGLVVRDPWAGLILDGLKSWEIRGQSTRVRGRIAIIRSGTKRIWGYCNLVGVEGPLTLRDLMDSCHRHRVPIEEIKTEGPPYPRTFAWVLESPQRLEHPIPYEHPKGAIIWVRLD